MKIWLVTEFFDSPSDTVGGYYVEGLAEKLATTEKAEVVFPADPEARGSENKTDYNTRHISRFRFNRKRLALRTFAQLLMSFQFFFFLIYRVKRKDIIVSFNHPPFFIFLSFFIKKIKGTKTIIVAYDLFPEILIATGVLKENLLYSFLLKMFSMAYNRADKVISLSDEMTCLLKKKIRNNHSAIYTIPNYADTTGICFQPKLKNEIILQYNLQSKIVFSYAGTIGRCQGIEKLLNLIGKINIKDNVHFLFFGKGIGVDSFLKQIADNMNHDLITYAGFIVTEDRMKFLNACDIAIISLLEGMTGLNFPSKTYNIMSSGHPIMFVGNEKSELAELITGFNIGWVCNPNDHVRFESVLKEIISDPSEIKLRGDKARSVAEKYFSKKEILDKYYEAILS